MRWDVKECSSTELPGFSTSWLPTGLPNKIKSFTRGNRVGLEVDTLVGSIPLKNGDTLQLLPRVGNANFIRMLVESEAASSAFRTADGALVHYSHSHEASLASLVVRPFVSALIAVDSGSVRFAWQRQREISDVAGGELDVLATAFRLAHHNAMPFVFSRKVRTIHVPENIVLAAAAHSVLRRYQKYLGNTEAKFLHAFERKFLSHTISNETITYVRNHLTTGSYDGARGYYANALRLGLIILGETGFKQGQSEEIRAEPVLFNSASIFEAYVRQQLKHRYHKRGLSIRKGFFPPMALFKEGSLVLDPDIVIAKDGGLLLVGDVKYKVNGMSASDFYQAHAYALRSGQKYFVFFCADEFATQVRATRRKSFLDVEVFEITLPLAHLSLAASALQSLEQFVPAFRPQ